MDKKQTAVEWLISELQRLPLEHRIEKAHLFYHAKQMEKEQILDAYYQCGRDNFEHIKVINRSATDYYNENYGEQK